jgi:hypothetical protein
VLLPRTCAVGNFIASSFTGQSGGVWQRRQVGRSMAALIFRAVVQGLEMAAPCPSKSGSDFQIADRRGSGD